MSAVGELKEPTIVIHPGDFIGSSSDECTQLSDEHGEGLTEEETVKLLDCPASVEDLASLYVEEEANEALYSSPRGVLEERSSESEMSCSLVNTSYFEAPGFPSIRGPWRGVVSRWILKSSVKRFSTIQHIVVPKLPRKGHRARRASQSDSVNPDFCFFKPSWKNFTISELEAATDNFSQDNIIGMGGYAEVYKGCLEDGQLVAIKRLTRGTADEQTSDFLSELGIIVHLNHPNTAKLIGFGVEGGMHLVLQLSPHGSLAALLHDSKVKPDWSVRYKIAIGTAEGLEYLHEKCQKRIIHRDIKAANVLLSEDFEAQICDFGLAKWLPEKLAHHVLTSFEGTFGYLAPEYMSHGIVDEKTDVFAFGVLLLELITGRKALDSSQNSLVMWAKPLLEKNDFKGLVDPSLGADYDLEQLNNIAQTAFLCTQESCVMRPRMSEVLKLLKGEEECLTLCQKTHRSHSEEIYDTDYDLAKHTKDLHQYRSSFLKYKFDLSLEVYVRRIVR